MKKGYFGEFGGCFVPELLMPPLQELEEAMRDIMPSPTFKEELDESIYKRVVSGRAAEPDNPEDQRPYVLIAGLREDFALCG